MGQVELIWTGGGGEAGVCVCVCVLSCVVHNKRTKCMWMNESAPVCVEGLVLRLFSLLCVCVCVCHGSVFVFPPLLLSSLVSCREFP